MPGTTAAPQTEPATKPAPEPEPTKADLATADELGNQFGRFMRIIAKAKSRLSSMNAGSVEHGAFPIIATLVKEGPHRTSALAEVLHADVSTISRQTSALVQAGLIARQADPDDGRACLLAPTAEGRALFERARAGRNRWLAQTLRDWPQADVDQLIGLLDRLNHDLAGSLGTPAATEDTTTSEGKTA